MGAKLLAAAGLKQMGARTLGFQKSGIVGGGAEGSFHDTEEAIRAFHRGRKSLPPQHHHFGLVRNGCRSSTAGQRDLSFLVGYQILDPQEPWPDMEPSPPALARERSRRTRQPEQRRTKAINVTGCFRMQPLRQMNFCLKFGNARPRRPACIRSDTNKRPAVNARRNEMVVLTGRRHRVPQCLS